MTRTQNAAGTGGRQGPCLPRFLEGGYIGQVFWKATVLGSFGVGHRNWS